MISLPLKVWALRIAAIISIVFLCFLAGSGIPSLTLALVWGPNGLFLYAFMRGALQLPRFLEPVKPIEPVFYRWVGVGLVKRIVATRLWPMVNGFEPPPKLKNLQEFLDRTEHTARGAEICHAATFILASSIALICLAVGRISEALWILAFNLVLNGYPVMLQRVHRWRIQQVRAQMHHENLGGERASVHEAIGLPPNNSLERTHGR
jgi:hypothetical protein